MAVTCPIGAANRHVVNRKNPRLGKSLSAIGASAVIDRNPCCHSTSIASAVDKPHVSYSDAGHYACMPAAALRSRARVAVPARRRSVSNNARRQPDPLGLSRTDCASGQDHVHRDAEADYRASRNVPPSMSGTPHRRQKTPNVADSSTTRRSHHTTSSNPPATAIPETAAITRLRQNQAAHSHRAVAVCLKAVTRAGGENLQVGPAQKFPPAPASTATRASLVSVKRPERLRQLLSRVPIDRVPHRRTIDRHRRHGPVGFDEN